MTQTAREIQADEAREAARGRAAAGRLALDQALHGDADAQHECNPPPARRWHFGQQWACPRCGTMYRCDGEKWRTEAEARASRTA
jgi:hypothetical protein